MKSSISIILIIFTILLYHSPLITCRASYGQPCNKSIRCDSLSTLTCQNSTCKCLKPDAMTYDLRRNTCVALAGEKCKFTVVEEHRSWHEDVGCVDNSYCDTPVGLCTCETNYIELTNGSCTPKRGYGGRCQDDSECRRDMHLTCVDSECKCDEEGAIFSFAHSQCVGLADKPCLNDLCTANALCRGYYGGHTMESYEEYSGEDTKCVCSPGYTMSPKGHCQVRHGGSCDFRESQCLHNFKCRDGSCVCKYKGHQVYEESYQDCYSLIGGPCTPKTSGSLMQQHFNFLNLNSTPIYCVKPAVCVPVGKFHECGCPEGTVESEDRRCELTFGRICQSQTGHKERGGNSNYLMKCDQLAPLYCIDGRCQCEDGLKIYDEQEKKCRGLVGSDCTLAEYNFCVFGASCRKNRGSEVKGQCKCMEDFHELHNRTCHPGGNEVFANFKI